MIVKIIVGVATIVGAQAAAAQTQNSTTNCYNMGYSVQCNTNTTTTSPPSTIDWSGFNQRQQQINQQNQQNMNQAFGNLGAAIAVGVERRRERKAAEEAADAAVEQARSTASNEWHVKEEQERRDQLQATLDQVKKILDSGNCDFARGYAAVGGEAAAVDLVEARCGAQGQKAAQTGAPITKLPIGLAPTQSSAKTTINSFQRLTFRHALPMSARLPLCRNSRSILQCN